MLTKIEYNRLEELIELYRQQALAYEDRVELYALLLEVEPTDKLFATACELIPELEERLSDGLHLEDEAWAEAILPQRTQSIRPNWMRWVATTAACLALALGLTYSLRSLWLGSSQSSIAEPYPHQVTQLKTVEQEYPSYRNGEQMTQEEVNLEVRRALALMNTDPVYERLRENKGMKLLKCIS